MVAEKRRRVTETFDVPCPDCDESQEITFRYLVSRLVGWPGPFVIEWPSYRCTSCGHTFEPLLIQFPADGTVTRKGN
jgi:hypothetical protein